MNNIERLSRPVDSDLLRTFVSVAEHQSVTRAGRQLGRTQSAVSVQVRKLERALSVELFERQARGVTLTDAGRVLLPAARKVLGEVDRIGDLFAEPLAGRVRIGIPDDYGSEMLERILAGFAARHGRVEVSMRFGNSARYQEALEDGELDLAVFAAEAEEERADSLFVERTVWAARDDWEPVAGQPVPLALFDQACWWREAALSALSQAGRRFRIAVTSESVSGVKAAVRTGLAVAMMAETALEPGMRILRVEDGFPALPTSSLVLRRNLSADSDPVREMERVIRAGFRSLGT